MASRSNAQSRAFKGLPPIEGEPVVDPPTWHAIHEFEEEPGAEVKELVQRGESELLRSAKQIEVRVFRLVRVHGEGIFFG